MDRFYRGAGAVHLLILVSLVMTLAAGARAEDPAKPVADKPADMYLLPEGGVDRLLEFIDQLKSYEPETFEAFLEHREKASVAMTAAAEKILQLQPDPTSRAYTEAALILLQTPQSGSVGVDAKRKGTLLDGLVEQVAGKQAIELEDLQLAMTAARSLELAGDTDLAARAYKRFGQLFAQNENKGIAGFGEQLRSSARRLQLLGNEMKVQGTTLDGRPFNLAALKGKVVLVDFWATWCGPCLAEIPNVKQLYERYHDRGFEVVGISLDQDRARLEQFVQARDIPWTILHDEASGGEHPAASYYGITAIPAMFLVGRDGKVLSLNARGPSLEELLERQFGPAETAAEIKSIKHP